MYIVEVTSNISNAYLPPLYGVLGRAERKNAMRSVKEYLEQVRKQADRVEYLMQDVQYLDDAMISTGSTSFGKTGGHAGSPQAGFVLLVERKDAKQRKLDVEKNRLVELITQADTAIDTVSDPKIRRVLKLYYLENLSTKEVADEMKYTVQHVNRLMNKGLEMVQLPEDEVILA